MNQTSQVVLGDMKSMRGNILALALLLEGALLGLAIADHVIALVVAATLAVALTVFSILRT